jgi:hypothetical protein
VNGGTTKFMDRLSEEQLSGKLAERLVIVQVANDLAAEAPEVVHVVANGFRWETRRGQVFDEAAKVR